MSPPFFSTASISDQLHGDRAERFVQVSENLRGIGAVPISRFAAASTAEIDGLFDLPEKPAIIRSYGRLQALTHLRDPGTGSSASASGSRAASAPSSSAGEGSTGANMQYVAQLHQTCITTFGNAHGLSFEFSEETGKPDSKKCILTISRPNGQSRSYTSEANFSRKSDAKARAAALAVKLGAVDFILHGYKDASKKQISLVPLESIEPVTATSSSSKAKEKEKEESMSKESSPEVELENDDASKEIWQYCKEWRAGVVKPRWTCFMDNKSSGKYGCALAIELTSHSRKLFSVPPISASKPDAKRECSTDALANGIVDYIKHGNGQLKPAEPVPALAIDDENGDMSTANGRKAISLQDFYESLPKPFPDNVSIDTEKQTATGVLNSTLQSAKGAKMTMDWFYVQQHGLHGSVIRLNRPGETTTYMVDPIFTKRNDAKSAVALQAMSEGACSYMRKMQGEVDAKISVEMRQFTSETILPILGSEYAKVRHGMHPQYEFKHEDGAFGATLILMLRDDPTPKEKRTWTVPAEYRTKNDAKIAVVHYAGREAIEFLRFRGGPAPPGHDAYKTARSEQKAAAAAKAQQMTKNLHQAKDENGKRKDKDKGRSNGRDGKQKLGNAQRHDNSRNNRAPRSSWNGNANPQNVAVAASAVINRITNAPRPHPSTPTMPAAMARSGSSTPSQMSNSPTVPLPYHPQTHISAPTSGGYPAPHPYHQYANPHYPPPVQAYAHSPPPPPAYPYQNPYAGPVYPYAYPPPPPTNSYPFPSTSAAPPAAPPPVFAIPPNPAYPYYPDPHNAHQPLHVPMEAYSNGGPPVVQEHYIQQPMHLMGPPPPMPHPAASPPRAGFQQHQRPNIETGEYMKDGSPLPTPPTSALVESRPSRVAASPRTRSVSHSHNGLAKGNGPPGNAEAARACPSDDANIHDDTSDSMPASATRTVSFGAGKRPRSRETTPEDVHVHKKHRSESSLPAVALRNSSSGCSDEIESKVNLSPQKPKEKSASFFEQLIQYCQEHHLPLPRLESEIIQDELGGETWKVWILHGKERLEMPVAFATKDDGRQRVSRLVLKRLRDKRAEAGLT